MKCGDKGHLARECRNATLYFACNRLGHKSSQCRSRTVASSSLKSKTLDPPSPPPGRPVSALIVANLPIVTRFGSSEASQRLEASFENSIVLTDSAGLGQNRIETALRHQMSQHNWVARFYDDTRYLIEAPNPRWLQSVTSWCSPFGKQRSACCAVGSDHG